MELSTRKGVVKVNVNTIENLPDERKRIKLSNEVKSKIKKDIENMPKSKLKQKEFKNEFWGYVDNNEKHAQYDLPIIYVEQLNEFKSQKDLFECVKPKQYLGQHYKMINKSCMCVDKKTGRILWIFITAEDDPALSYCLKDAEEVIEGFDKYVPKKSGTFYSQNYYVGATTRKQDEKRDRPTELEKRYLGVNWLDGLQRFLDGSRGHNFICYYKMKKEGQSDMDWRYKEARLYTLLYALEKRYAPSVAQFRLDLAERVGFVGCLPDLDIKLNPSTSMGASIDFCSSFHKDSSVKGTIECIIWKKSQKKSMFVNGVSGHYFNLNQDCMILQVGTDYHGTAPTGKHGGLGFVNLTKSILVGNTPYNKKWYELWKKYLNM